MDLRELRQEHRTASVSVYYSREYDRFTLKKGNRQLNSRKIQRIKDAVTEKGLDLFKYNPILVSEREDGLLEIEDGQHRYKACRQLRGNIYYMVLREPMKIADVAALNRNQEKWKPQDFVTAFSSKGIEDYKYLDKFVRVFNMPISLSATLLAHGTPYNSKRVNDLIETGTFRAKHRAEAVKLGRTLHYFRAYRLHRSRAFASAVCKLLHSDKPFSWERLITLFNRRADTMEKSSDYKGYLLQLETIYNHKLKERVTLY